MASSLLRDELFRSYGDLKVTSTAMRELAGLLTMAYEGIPEFSGNISFDWSELYPQDNGKSRVLRPKSKLMHDADTYINGLGEKLDIKLGMLRTIVTKLDPHFDAALAFTTQFEALLKLPPNGEEFKEILSVSHNGDE